MSTSQHPGRRGRLAEIVDEVDRRHLELVAAVLAEAGGGAERAARCPSSGVRPGSASGALLGGLVEPVLVDQHGDRQPLDLEAVMRGLDRARRDLVVGGFLAAVVGLVRVLAGVAPDLLAWSGRFCCTEAAARVDEFCAGAFSFTVRTERSTREVGS